MGIVEFMVFVVVVVFIGWLAVWLLGRLAPGHPAIVDNVVWIIVVFIIVMTLANAVGLLGHDPMIPRIR